jgi:hypothetical protein
MNEHLFVPEDIATYALGALPAKSDLPNDSAQRVAEHLKTCDRCRQEYDLLRPVVTMLGASAEAPEVSALLKQRIMREVRKTANPNVSRPVAAAAQPPARKAILWPAYLVAAAGFAIALISTIESISLTGQLKSAQTQLAALQTSTNLTAREIAAERTMVADLMAGDSKRFPITNGQIVARGKRLYIAMHDLAPLPKGRVYQAWTLPKGAKKVAPSITFLPDTHGIAVVALPEDAQTTAAVAVSVEPEGGSKAPTTKPIAIVPLSSE